MKLFCNETSGFVWTVRHHIYNKRALSLRTMLSEILKFNIQNENKKKHSFYILGNDIHVGTKPCISYCFIGSLVTLPSTVFIPLTYGHLIYVYLWAKLQKNSETNKHFHNKLLI